MQDNKLTEVYRGQFTLSEENEVFVFVLSVKFPSVELKGSIEADKLRKICWNLSKKA